MPASDAGKISPQLLKQYGISQDGFEYVESFLFCIKYIKANPRFYFKSFQEFLSGRDEYGLVSNVNVNSSPFDGYWFNKVVDAESVIDKAPENLKKFYDFWYYRESDNIVEVFGYSSRHMYRKRDVNRISLCKIVEDATLIVPLKLFYTKNGEPSDLG